MINRLAHAKLEKALKRQPAVAMIGPRQVGKTTLAKKIASQRPSIYLDLERSEDRAKLSSPRSYLNMHQDKLVVLDEIHRLPEIFNELRGIIDDGREAGNDYGRFLILGSASMELMRQSETLAGRIAYIDLPPLLCSDVSDMMPDTLWLRGGYPRSLLALDDEDSFDNRLDFIRSYLERDVPMFAPRLSATAVEQLWTMLAHNQGTLLNSSKLAGNLGLTNSSIKRYIGLLTNLLLVRQLPPYFTNTKKRLIKTPKTYVRDSGLVHALLRIESIDELLGHPVVGNSWEGFVIENILSVVPRRTLASFYRTSAGAEIDLVLDMGPKHGIWGIEIKRSEAPTVSKGFYNALEDIQPNKAFIVYSGQERYPKTDSIEVISLGEMIKDLQALTG